MAYAKQNNKPVDRSCPSPADRVVHYLTNTRQARPRCFPIDPHAAAMFWISHQPAIDGFTESATPPVTPGGSWKTPYHDRLVERLRIFAQLSADEQMFVITSIEAGVPWRGDPIDMYKSIIEEEAKMQSRIQAGQKEDYRDDVFKQMKRKLKGLLV